MKLEKKLKDNSLGRFFLEGLPGNRSSPRYCLKQVEMTNKHEYY